LYYNFLPREGQSSWKESSKRKAAQTGGSKTNQSVFPSLIRTFLTDYFSLDLPDDGWIWSFRPTGNLTKEELEEWVAEGSLRCSFLGYHFH